MSAWSAKSFVGGDVVLDFLNTAGGDTKSRDFDRLETYSDVLTWARAADVIEAGEFGELVSIAGKSPDRAAKDLDQLKTQREVFYRYLTAPMDRKPIPEKDRLDVERGFRTALSHARLVPSPTQPSRWQVPLEGASLSVVQFRLALAASALMTSSASSDIRQCERCTWLFLDPSESKRRRWCSMAVCGNRAKAMRHYSRSANTRA